MDYNQPFSVLNERLRPRVHTGSQIYSSLNRLEDRSSRVTSIYYTRPSILPTTSAPERPKVSGRDDLDKTLKVTAQDELDNTLNSDPPQLFEDNSTLLSEMGLNEAGDEDDSSSTKSEEKDCPGELSSVNRIEEAPESPSATEGDAPKESILHKAFIDGTLPDLIKSGRPLGRRNTLGHVNDTLKEVRREVELSRRRSIRLKAQVDKLQESHEGQGWSQDRERVTEEVLSILRLLHPLTDAEPLRAPVGENRLDTALQQLLFVSRKLALDHTTQNNSESGESTAEKMAILQQALRDRDDAIEKKLAMEGELLRSKTEMMALNNQLLEAAQKRLELSLELEAWKEDVQLMIQQQVQAQQQQAEQSSKRNLRGILRRNKQPPIQRPASVPVQAPPSSTNANHIYVNRPASPSPAAAAAQHQIQHQLSLPDQVPVWPIQGLCHETGDSRRRGDIQIMNAEMMGFRSYH
ncbi:hypothetical protein WMY93_007685 [Mugilogobius chulae]|uniref:Uncharacterized protein n=1 Tax=Mugilogobius chulae TaxID=88201 RepID=A0AAW0PHD4_9GOBI